MRKGLNSIGWSLDEVSHVTSPTQLTPARNPLSRLGAGRSGSLKPSDLPVRLATNARLDGLTDADSVYSVVGTTGGGH